MEEIYGEFGASLGDRVKKRRRINYCEDDDDDDVMNLDDPDSKRRRRRDYSDDSRSPSPEGSLQAILKAGFQFGMYDVHNFYGNHTLLLNVRAHCTYSDRNL